MGIFNFKIVVIYYSYTFPTFKFKFKILYCLKKFILCSNYNNKKRYAQTQ